MIFLPGLSGQPPAIVRTGCPGVGCDWTSLGRLSGLVHHLLPTATRPRSSRTRSLSCRGLKWAKCSA